MGQTVYQRPDEEQMLREVEDKLKTDASFLKIVHSMMWAYAEESEEEDPIIDYEIDGTPTTKSQFLKEADAAVEEVRNGGGTPADEFFKEKIQWLNDMKYRIEVS